MFNILIVEDNEKIRSQLCVLLKNNAYNPLYILDFTGVSNFVKDNKLIYYCLI